MAKKRAARSGKDDGLEGYQEHHVADLVVAELREMPPSDERWAQK